MIKIQLYVIFRSIYFSLGQNPKMELSLVTQGLELYAIQPKLRLERKVGGKGWYPQRKILALGV